MIADCEVLVSTYLRTQVGRWKRVDQNVVVSGARREDSCTWRHPRRPFMIHFHRILLLLLLPNPRSDSNWRRSIDCTVYPSTPIDAGPDSNVSYRDSFCPRRYCRPILCFFFAI